MSASPHVSPVPERTPAAWLPMAAILAATLLAYLPALDAAYIWDDDYYVTNNATLRTLDGLRQIWLVPGATPQYYPLVFTTFWIEYQLWQLAPLGYHLVNVLLHATNALLVACVLRRLGVRGAWLVAALFALHPVHVESVAWVTERKNVLSGTFYLLALLAYIRFAGLHQGMPAPGPRRWRWYAASAVSFVAALLAKTVTCSLPAVLLLLTWWRRGRVGLRDVLPTLPLFVVGAALARFTVWMEQHHVGVKALDFGLSSWERVLLAGRSAWFYLGKLVWPHPLVFIYPRWIIDGGDIAAVLWPLGVLLVVVGLWLARRRIGRGPLVAVLFFGGTLVPALGFIDVYPMRYSWVADHFQYLASLGPLTLIGAGTAMLLRSATPGRIGARVCAGLVLIAAAALTWMQSTTYRSAETLWRTTIQRNPGAWMAYNNLGALLTQRGEAAEAVALFDRSLTLLPENPAALSNLAYHALGRGELDAAIDLCRRAIAQPGPKQREAHNNLGLALLSAGRPAEAVPAFEEALRISPLYAPALFNLGEALQRVGRVPEALQRMSEGLRLMPAANDVRAKRGDLLFVSNRPQEAIGEYERVLLRDPRHLKARYNLANVLLAQGDLRGAAVQANEVIQLAPKGADGHNLLASIFAQGERPDLALQHYRFAVQHDPNLSEARFNLATTLLQFGKRDEAVAELRELLRRVPSDAEARRLLSEIGVAESRPGGAANP